jgi:hypothetical protein
MTPANSLNGKFRVSMMHFDVDDSTLKLLNERYKEMKEKAKKLLNSVASN